jgi:hypothetical protein
MVCSARVQHNFSSIFPSLHHIICLIAFFISTVASLCVPHTPGVLPARRTRSARRADEEAAVAATLASLPGDLCSSHHHIPLGLTLRIRFFLCGNCLCTCGWSDNTPWNWEFLFSSVCCLAGLRKGGPGAGRTPRRRLQGGAPDSGSEAPLPSEATGAPARRPRAPPAVETVTETEAVVDSDASTATSPAGTPPASPQRLAQHKARVLLLA